jgi:stage II sporulation protein R
MIKRILALMLAVVLLVSACYAGKAALQQHALSDKLIRLHVVANSDTPADQAVKLQVRDAVLAQVSELTAQCRTEKQAEQQLQENLPLLSAAARRALQTAGVADAVAVTLTREDFPTRCYSSFTLPAGTYESLRVRIGAGKGHNWWCVVFPSLCSAATEQELEENAEAGGFSSDETETISGGETKYVLKFKTLEYLQRLLKLFD